MRKRIVIWCVIIMVVLMGGLFLVLPKTVKCQEIITVCTSEGDTEQVKFDVELERFLLLDDEWKGTITIGDVTYTSVKDLYGDAWEGDSYVFQQYRSDYALNNHENQVFFELYEDGFGAFMLHVSNKDGEELTYYGPAENVEEVEIIWEKYMK